MIARNRYLDEVDWTEAIIWDDEAKIEPIVLPQPEDRMIVPFPSQSSVLARKPEVDVSLLIHL